MDDDDIPFDRPASPWDVQPDPGEGCTLFPNILFDLDLDPDEAVVLLALIRVRHELFARSRSLGPRPTFPLDCLARHCFRLPPPTVVRIVGRLEERGFITFIDPFDYTDFSRAMPNLSHLGDMCGNYAPVTTFEFVDRFQDPARLELARAQRERWGLLKRREELATMPYRDYLLTPEWKARREVEIQRANGHCELCNAAGPFHVHHRTYERRGDEAPGDLLVLCPPCHKTFHSHRTLA